MSDAQFWTAVALFGLVFVAFCVGAVVVVDRGATRICRDLNKTIKEVDRCLNYLRES